MLRLTLVVVGLLAATASAEMYKWVDKNGKQHFGDAVPVEYQQQAVPVKQAAQPTREQQAEAASAASRTKALAEEYDYRHQTQQAELREKRKAAEQAATEKKKRKQTNDKSCEARLKRYHESAECFNQYRNANGSLKAAAYEKCKDVEAPEDCL